ncbi:helix-turn-helix transcriptional regulator [Brevibacillus borstelensis]|uniref:helix-turn-helix transcriptional regulator n=1 Tax=Brevibacillus borstelensis TaxID=45462 RepID=UPI003CC921EF
MRRESQLSLKKRKESVGVSTKTCSIFMKRLDGYRWCVSKHITNVMQKLGVKGRSQAVVKLVRLGELEI